MRIKDLATRATKLLTGNAWFVVDNGTKVEKAAYAEVVKQGIEEYAGSTLAGSAQTVKSAIDALNSKFGRALGNNPNFNNIVEPGFYYFGDVTDAVNPPNKDAGYLNMLVLRVGDMVTQVVFGARQLLQSGRDKIWVRYRNGNSDSYWNEWIAYATQSEVDALNSNVGTLSGIKTVVVNDTTNDVGIITLNVGAFTGRPYVISNISANFVTPYRIICDSWTASTGSISIRVRNSTDNAAVANTTIQDTILIIFSR